MEHNGIPCNYALLQWQYYWKGMRAQVHMHMKACRMCAMHNKEAVKYSKLHFEAEPTPMKLSQYT